MIAEVGSETEFVPDSIVKVGQFPRHRAPNAKRFDWNSVIVKRHRVTAQKAAQPRQRLLADIHSSPGANRF